MLQKHIPLTAINQPTMGGKADKIQQQNDEPNGSENTGHNKPINNQLSIDSTTSLTSTEMIPTGLKNLGYEIYHSIGSGGFST